MSNRQLYDQDFYAWANEQAYRRAIVDAVVETSLKKISFPQPCPWTFDEIMDSTFYPEATH